jgi:hypothetical protein
MASQAPFPRHAADLDDQTTSEDDRIAAFDEAEGVEPVQPSVAVRQQAYGLVASAPSKTMLAGGTVAVLLGGAVGYWLGARRSSPPVRKAKRTVSTTESAIELLPVAIQLLANPVVRSLAIRLLLRRLAS